MYNMFRYVAASGADAFTDILTRSPGTKQN